MEKVTTHSWVNLGSCGVLSITCTQVTLTQLICAPFSEKQWKEGVLGESFI